MKNPVIAGALLLLAACGGGTENESPPAGDAGAGAAAGGSDSDSVDPGEWELTSEVLAMEIPGAPAAAQAVDNMPKTTDRKCIRPEDANFSATMRDAGEDSQCSNPDVSVRGGKLQGSMTCTEDGQKTTMTMAGDVGARNFDINIETVGGAGAQRTTMRSRLAGKWVGECSAASDEAGEDGQ